MIKILKLATWKTAQSDECFIAQGSRLDELIVIFSGRACVEMEGKVVAEILPGQFIGSVSYVTDKTAPANIIALEPTCYVTWPKAKLEKFLDGNSELHTALEKTLAMDLARALQDSWARQPS